MKRRKLLAVAGCSAALAIAGCSALTDGEEGDDEEDDGEDENEDIGGEEDVALRGSLTGLVAPDLDFSSQEARYIEQTVADELGTESINVLAQYEDGTVEVFGEGISTSEFVDALAAAGVETTADQIQAGISEDVRSDLEETIEERLDRTELDGEVSVTETDDGTEILIDVPEEERADAREIIEEYSHVQIVAGYPDPDDESEPAMEEVLTGEDFTRIRGAETGPEGQAHVGVTLTEDARDHFAERLVETGFTNEGIGLCDFDPEEDEPSPDEYCLYTVVGDEIRHGAAMGDIAMTLEDHVDGELTWDGSFQINTGDIEEAEQLSVALQSGTLPAALEVEEAD